MSIFMSSLSQITLIRTWVKSSQRDLIRSAPNYNIAMHATDVQYVFTIVN